MRGLRQFNVHKSRGTCKFVHVKAERVEFVGGSAVFWTGERLVMSYAPWAWKTVYEDTTDG